MTTMRRMGLVSLGLIGAIAAACGTPAYAPVAGPMPATINTATSQAVGAESNGMELMVALKDRRDVAKLQAVGKQLGFTVTKSWPEIGSAAIRLERFGAGPKVAQGLKTSVGASSVQPAGRPVLEAVNDPLAGEQFGMRLMQVENAWRIEPGKATTKIAIVDTGVDLTHPDLKDKLVPGYNAVNKNQPPADDHGHGTHCAGIAAAAVNNGLGVIGVGGNCSIMPVKVLSRGSGSEATIVDGIMWAANNGANVMSMSIGLYRRSVPLERALQYALDKGVTLVASAGNNNAENDHEKYPHLPSTHPGVIEVAAVDAVDQKASFSNYGKTVSVAAPGVGILSTLPGGKYGKMSGTSMAAPHVAGLAGLVLSKHPTWRPAQVKAAIEKGADDKGAPGFDPIFGHGRANAFGTIQR